MEFKGTKGEWFVKHTHIYCDTGIVALSGSVRKIDESRNEEESWLSMYERNKSVREELKKEREANAKLIAAAPDLLESLQDINEKIDNYWNGEKSDYNVNQITKSQQKSLKAIEKALK